MRPSTSVATQNFVIAFCGGGLISKLVGAISLWGIQVGSLVALLFGISISLLINSTMKQRLSVEFVSIASILLSGGILLFMLKVDRAYDMVGLFLLVVISLRFAFWFLSRLLRSAQLAEASEKELNWVESAFHGGTFLGILAVDFGANQLEIHQVLVIGIVGQVLSLGLFRWTTKGISVSQGEATAAVPFDRKWHMWAVHFVLITLLVQITLFDVSHVKDNIHIVGLFYFSLGLTGLLVTFYPSRIVDHPIRLQVYNSKEDLVIQVRARTLLVWMTVFIAMTSLAEKQWLMMTGAVVASIIYEVYAVAALHQIAKNAGRALFVNAFAASGLFGGIYLILLHALDGQTSIKILCLAGLFCLALFTLGQKSEPHQS